MTSLVQYSESDSETNSPIKPKKRVYSPITFTENKQKHIKVTDTSSSQSSESKKKLIHHSIIKDTLEQPIPVHEKEVEQIPQITLSKHLKCSDALTVHFTAIKFNK